MLERAPHQPRRNDLVIEQRRYEWPYRIYRVRTRTPSALVGRIHEFFSRSERSITSEPVRMASFAHSRSKYSIFPVFPPEIRWITGVSSGLNNLDGFLSGSTDSKDLRNRCKSALAVHSGSATTSNRLVYCGSSISSC